MPRRIALISTGGTIEKTYDELHGILHNKVSVLDVMLSSLQLNGVVIERHALVNKDSLELSDGDHGIIAAKVAALAPESVGIVSVDGTDRLANSGVRIVEVCGVPRVPVVLCVAMRPYVRRNTDALQNLIEALLAVQILEPGVYVAMHNHVLRFPGVVKDRERGTFVRREEH
jgi:L-asparaginase